MGSPSDLHQLTNKTVLYIVFDISKNFLCLWTILKVFVLKNLFNLVILKWYKISKISIGGILTMGQEKGLWSWVGRIGGLLTLALSVYTVYALFIKPDYNVIAQAEIIETEFPKFEQETPKKNIDEKEIQKLLLDGSKEEKESLKYLGDKFASEKIASHIKDYVERIFPESTKTNFNFRTIFLLTIENIGKKEATEIELIAPFDSTIYKGIYKIQTTDEKQSKVFDLKEKISIGSIRPTSKVNVIIWSEQTFSVYDRKKIILTHKDGVVSIGYTEKVSGLVAFIMQESQEGYFTIIYVLLSFVAIVPGLLIFLNVFTFGVVGAIDRLLWKLTSFRNRLYNHLYKNQ
jgi:hypothetical protein